MENMSLLEKFADPNVINTMSSSEKMVATLYTTILGMGITFAALLVIWATTAIMSKIIRYLENRNKEEIVRVVEPKKEEIVKIAENENGEDDEELIAVISAAIAASLNTSIHNIVVRNIIRVDDKTPAWGKAGTIEQMNSRF
jgi:sodium pump decarboxylase gamma subunit